MDGIRFRIESVEVLGPLLAVFTVFAVLGAARGWAGWRSGPALTRVVAAVYAAGVLHFTMFPIIVDKQQNLAPWTSQVQVMPFLSVLEMDPGFVENIVLFMPFGFLLPLLTGRILPLRGVALRALGVSAAIELTQLGMYMWFSNGRAGDVDDLMANTLGGVVGAFLLGRCLRSSAASTAVRSFALPHSTAGRHRSGTYIDRGAAVRGEAVPAPLEAHGRGAHVDTFTEPGSPRGR
ncbi:VanZ family protein [Streptomyces erythrochromogenes]|uniref:VanZ family protein n=1 Tax=Streptomyces erythrochromogenes TaxID=285574 RepID=UPI0034196B37